MLTIREVVAVYQGESKPLPSILNSVDLARFAREVIPSGPQERTIGIATDAKNRPIAWYTVGIGGVSSCPVDLSSVFRPALLAGASGLFLAHNHPSGDPTPSKDDREITERVQEGARTLGLSFLDHVIVTDREHFSFADTGAL